MTIIDDYGHHPVEIRAVLSAAREATQSSPRGRVIAVVQPHRYTRLQRLMEEFQSAFNDADIVFVAPVYAAGEEPIEGVDSEALVEGLARAATAWSRAVAEPERTRRGAARSRRRRRHGHLPRRRRHHQMGGGPGGRHPRRAEEQMSAVADPFVPSEVEGAARRARQARPNGVGAS